MCGIGWVSARQYDDRKKDDLTLHYHRQNQKSCIAAHLSLRNPFIQQSMLGRPNLTVGLWWCFNIKVESIPRRSLTNSLAT